VVIVNYRQWENTARLVGQILARPGPLHGEVEVVVVDNHSSAHPLAARLRRWPTVSLRCWGRNCGFARAVNEGCRLSRAGWLLLLNPDVSVSASFLDGVLSLTEYLEIGEPNSGLVGFHLRNSDGTPQGSAGPFPTLLGTLAGLLRPRWRRKYRSRASRQRCQVPWVTGCCLLIRRACLKQLHGLDEDFFLYYEDVDLCRRAQAQGWSVWYEPALSVIHHRPLHRRAVPAPLRMCTRHALLTYGAKHWPRWQLRILVVIVRVESWLRRCWARWQADSAAAAVYRDLAAIAIDVLQGRWAVARRRLDRHVQRMAA
jgi:GT2 family glycosyltransferase